MSYFFIVGCQRSGTTMIQQALNRHSRVLIPPETGFFTHLLGHARRGQACHLRTINRDLGIELPGPKRRIWRASDVLRYFEDMFHQYRARSGKKDADLLGEKTPHHILRTRRIARYFPGAKIIAVHRDGRDVALSLTKVPWFSNNLLVCFGYWLRCLRESERMLRSPLLDVHCVAYESIVTDPQAELAEICAFLGIDYEESMAQGDGVVRGVAHEESHWMALAGKPITSNRAGAWRDELTCEQVQSLNRWGWRALKTLGYELDPKDQNRAAIAIRLRARIATMRWRTRNALRVLRKNLLGVDEFA